MGSWGDKMYEANQNEHVEKIIDVILSFPLPATYNKILVEQIAGCTVGVEQYHDCLKLLFKPSIGLKMFPLQIPTLLQGCQIFKESGPISCQLFVEKGYIVQFEIVDMGGNTIDWDFFWHNISNAIYDVEYGASDDFLS